MIVAVPLPVAVARPVESTVATCGSPPDQTTHETSITSPCWSWTSARNCTVDPSAANSAVAGVTVTVVGTGSSTALSSHAAARVAARAATSVVVLLGVMALSVD